MADNVEIKISLKDLTGPGAAQVARQLRGIERGITSVSDEMSHAKRASDAFATAGSNLRKQFAFIPTATKWLGGLGTAAGAVAGGAFAWLGKSVYDAGTGFENLQTRLITFQGSAEAAGSAVSWIEDFAVRTPYQLDEVGDAFVRMRANGLDPFNGGLLKLGDTAAATGKDLEQVVEAIGDATRGEGERLIELGTGLRISNQNGIVTVMRAGEAIGQFQRDSKELSDFLTNELGRQFEGSMERLSKTVSGRVSNIGDAWLRFRKQIFQSGLGDFALQEVNGLLDSIEKLNRDGTLARWAKQISDSMIETYKWVKNVGMALFDFGREHWDDIVSGFRSVVSVAKEFASAAVGVVRWTNDIAQALGGWENVIQLAAVAWGAFKFTSVIGELTALAGALRAVTAASGGIAALGGSVGTGGLALAAGALAAGATFYNQVTGDNYAQQGRNAEATARLGEVQSRRAAMIRDRFGGSEAAYKEALRTASLDSLAKRFPQVVKNEPFSLEAGGFNFAQTPNVDSFEAAVAKFGNTVKVQADKAKEGQKVDVNLNIENKDKASRITSRLVASSPGLNLRVVIPTQSSGGL